MAQKQLILDRYEVMGTAGAGGFGTVQIAWDPRIQRKVAIKTIMLTERDAYRAGLPGAEAVAKSSSGAVRGEGALTPAQKRTARLQQQEDEYDYPFASATVSGHRSGRTQPLGGQSDQAPAGEWRGVTPWGEFIEEENAREGRDSRDMLDLPEVLKVPEVFVVPPVGNARDGGTMLMDEGPADGPDAGDGEAPSDEPVTSLAHVPGLDEARTAAKLSDSRIVTVYDFEVRDRTAYLIMEYIEGITLTDLLADYEDFLTLDMVTGVFDAVAGALTVAHKAGVLHLDIKPDNIIINKDGQAKVTDFGLATLADASGAGTTGGGTIGYMPLEQMRREHLDARTDEWSLAAVAYEMLTGDNPFRASTLKEAEQAILEAEMVLPSLCWGTIDSQIDDVVFYALDPDREERYANVKDFAEEMDKFLGDEEKGRGELALVVAEALASGRGEDEDVDEEPDGEEETIGWLPFGPAQLGLSKRGSKERPQRRPAGREHSAREERRRERPRLEERLSAYLADYEAEEESAGEWLEEPAEEQEPFLREPWANRIPERLLAVGSRAFGAAGCGFLGALALGNIPPLTMLLGGQSPLAMAVGAVALAVASLLRPSLAALVSFCLLALAILFCGHPVVAAVLAVAAALWWYITGREGAADANVALLEPLAGSVGLSPVVPLAAGMALRPIQAGVTVAFAAVVACVLGSLGSSSLLGWDAFATWSFADADITRTFARIITRPLTWTTLAGWLVAAVCLSLLSMSGRRWGLVAGLAVAAAALLAGMLVFTTPTPQLFLAIIAGVGAICVLFL